MKFIISPAKSQKTKIELPKFDLPYSTPIFVDEAMEIMKKLKTFPLQEIRKLMGVSEKIALLNIERYKRFSSVHDKNNSIPAIFLYSGDVFQEINPASLSEKELLFLNENCRILSGLYGVLKPLDLIQPYRLEMAIRISMGKKKDLYDYWTEKITSNIKRFLGGDTLYNLSSVEYSKSVQVPMKQFEVLNIAGETYKGYALKRQRGKIVRFMVENALVSEDTLIGDYSETLKIKEAPKN